MPTREGNKWRGVIKINGKKVLQKSGFSLKREAKAWEDKERKRLKQPTLRTGPDLLNICSKYILYSERFSEKVQDEKRRTCKRILKEWGPATPIDTITGYMAELYLSKQRATRGAHASNRDRTNLHAMWEKGKKTWGLKSNPFAETEKFPHDRLTQFTPTTEMVLSVLMAANRKEQLLLKCYIQTGARRSEIFRWTWIDDVNLEKKTIRLGTRKTKDGSMRYRYQGLSAELHSELVWLWNNRKLKDNPYVFPIEKGKHKGEPYKEMRNLLPKLCRKAFAPGCRSTKKYIDNNLGPVFGFHAIRRFCASMLADSGKSIKRIQEWLGHQSFRTTEIYIHNISTDNQDMSEALTTDKLTASVPGCGAPESTETTANHSK